MPKRKASTTMTINAIMMAMKWAKSGKWQDRYFHAKTKGVYDNDDIIVTEKKWENWGQQ